MLKNEICSCVENIEPRHGRSSDEKLMAIEKEIHDFKIYEKYLEPNMDAVIEYDWERIELYNKLISNAMTDLLARLEAIIQEGR